MTTRLDPDDLYRCCEPDVFNFETTDEITDFQGTVGQEKALRSLDFGLGLSSKGFNIFALGEVGTGKLTTVRAILNEKASKEAVPQDWCYVYNFKDPDAPRSISLPPGKGVAFRKDMEDLVQVLRVEIPRAFESKEYEKQRSRIIEEFQQKQKELFTKLEEEAQSQGFAIRKAVAGLIIVPVKKSGEPLTEEEFSGLDDKTKKTVEEMGRGFQEKLDDVMRAVKEAEKFVKEMLSRLEREIALSAVGSHIEELVAKYGEYEKILSYLDQVKEDILSHLDDFKATEEQQPPLPFMKMGKAEVSFTRYSINVVVSNAGKQAAPVILETNPTYLNIFGRIEYKVQYGMALTDFSMIRAGSLHHANGGYLVVNAADLLRNIFSYDALKRAIKNGEIRIEDVWEQYRLVSTTNLKPEPIPLDVKVILLGTPYIYYLLYNLDEEYRDLFKVKADFDSRMERTTENTRTYISFLASCVREDKLLHFDRTGVAKIVEYGARLAGHQDKLSTRFAEIVDMMREAHYWAQKAGSPVIRSEHVVKAADERVFRVNRIEERLREMTLQDTLIIRTDGTAVGQINGLAVLDLGDYSFGKPSRITCKSWTGKAGVVNIERETKMSGRIHDKAIMIISNYLASTYATKRPLSVSASIAFEQLYEMIEGDSASCAELYALLSSIAGVALKQCLAVTGSMDQGGDVQPIGGVNEKIEGFFGLCKARGLDGSHGVVIPRRNVKNLMLRQEVIDAVRAGQFSIYPIDRAEEGLELFTGLPAGIRQTDGAYPAGSVHALVASRLEEIADALEKKKDKDKNKDEDNGK